MIERIARKKKYLLMIDQHLKRYNQAIKNNITQFHTLPFILKKNMVHETVSASNAAANYFMYNPWRRHFFGGDVPERYTLHLDDPSVTSAVRVGRGDRPAVTYRTHSRNPHSAAHTFGTRLEATPFGASEILAGSHTMPSPSEHVFLKTNEDVCDMLPAGKGVGTALCAPVDGLCRKSAYCHRE